MLACSILVFGRINMKNTPPKDPDDSAKNSPVSTPIFSFQEFPALAGSPTPRCNTKAKLEAGKIPLQGVMLRLPIPLRQRIEEQTAGSMSVTICALVEYALNELEEQGIAIVVANHKA